jgi:hypothetical protein
MDGQEQHTGGASFEYQSNEVDKAAANSVASDQSLATEKRNSSRMPKSSNTDTNISSLDSSLIPSASSQKRRTLSGDTLYAPHSDYSSQERTLSSKNATTSGQNASGKLLFQFTDDIEFNKDDIKDLDYVPKGSSKATKASKPRPGSGIAIRTKPKSTKSSSVGATTQGMMGALTSNHMHTSSLSESADFASSAGLPLSNGHALNGDGLLNNGLYWNNSVSLTATQTSFPLNMSAWNNAFAFGCGFPCSNGSMSTGEPQAPAPSESDGVSLPVGSSTQFDGLGTLPDNLSPCSLYERFPPVSKERVPSSHCESYADPIFANGVRVLSSQISGSNVLGKRSAEQEDVLDGPPCKRSCSVEEGFPVAAKLSAQPLCDEERGDVRPTETLIDGGVSAFAPAMEGCTRGLQPAIGKLEEPLDYSCLFSPMQVDDTDGMLMMADDALADAGFYPDGSMTFNGDWSIHCGF